MVTILTYGERLTIDVRFHIGQRRQISQGELVDYITDLRQFGFRFKEDPVGLACK